MIILDKNPDLSVQLSASFSDVMELSNDLDTQFKQLYDFTNEPILFTPEKESNFVDEISRINIEEHLDKTKINLIGTINKNGKLHTFNNMQV